MAASDWSRIINPNAIVAAVDAADAAWSQAGAPVGKPSKDNMVAVRISPSGKGEIYATAEPLRPESGIFFFAAASPAQVYAVAGFKCSVAGRVKAGASEVGFIVIQDTDDDRAIGKSPLAPIGCTVGELHTAMNKQRVFAASVVAPAIASAAAKAGGVVLRG